MNSKQLNERLSYYEMDAISDSARGAVKKAFLRISGRATDKLYDKILATPAIAHNFKNSEHVQSAKGLQLGHWMEVFGSEPNENYVERATHIGFVHAKLGLEPSYYIGAYSLMLREIVNEIIMPGLWKFVPWRRSKAKKINALICCALLDMNFSLDGYFKENQSNRERTVSQIGEALAKIAQGDLTARVDNLPKEFAQIGVDLNSATDALRDALSKMSGGITAMSTGSDEIRFASDDLARRTEQQATNLEKTASAINDVTSKVGETASAANNARMEINSTQQQALEGSSVVEQAVDAMSRIEESSKQISQIISVIDGISFQTNLLALNAGVEAARAGESGKGFAVVASEVRALAQRSADAANDIKSLITISAQQVANGVDLVGRSGVAFGGITERVNSLSLALETIADTTQSQAQNLSQINTSVGEMDRMTQQNAAMAEECTAAARSLAEQSDEMTKVVGGFNVGAGGSDYPADRLAA